MRYTRPLAAALLASLVCLTLSESMLSVAAANPQQSPQVGSIKVTKSVPSITLDNRVTILLTIKNNGSVPIADFEIYEYFNPAFSLEGTVTIAQPSGKVVVPMAQTGTVTTQQAIIDPPSPDSLQPGQSMTLEYAEVTSGPGDFTVPASLTWYTYDIGTSSVRASVYSNRVIVHIANQAEKVILVVYPYVLAATTFTVTMTILLWARRKLAHVDEKLLSR